VSGMIIEPETVTHAKKQAAKQRQLERRGIARELLPAMIAKYGVLGDPIVKLSLNLADELLAQTKVDE
jgi:hypothetical protein